MRLPELAGLIRRRLLVNFKVDPAVMQSLVPAPFKPKLHKGYAIAGVCLINLDHVRPRYLPSWLGVASENAAHRVAVEWEDTTGLHEGVYINRRDSSSLINRLAGGRLFPGEHHAAEFQVEDDGQRVSLRMFSKDGNVTIDLAGAACPDFPQTSVFASIAEASAFFESGSLGYSDTQAGGLLDGMCLITEAWTVAPFLVEHVHSSYFEDLTRFPAGSVEFDSGLVMRNIAHVWRSAPALRAGASQVPPICASANV